MTCAEDGWFWLFAVVQLAGVVSCLGTRLLETGAAARWLRPLFVGCLVVIGLSTISALHHGSPCWAANGVVFSLLSLAATFDPRGSIEANSF